MAMLVMGGLLVYQGVVLFDGPFRADYRSAGEYMVKNAAPDDVFLSFQLATCGLELTAPEAHGRSVFVYIWPDIAAMAQDVISRGPDVWVLAHLRFNPDKIERDFRNRGLDFTAKDFAGQPRLRVYHVYKKQTE